MVFMKILHYSVFYASKAVSNWLYAQEIDPNTVHLNDYKFMERIFYITVNHLGIKPRLAIGQFFKYGFAEQKMMMCVDTIRSVKSLNKKIRRERSLSSSRKMTIRQLSQSREERFTNSSVKLVNKGKTLAEVQEDMRQDFQTQEMQNAKRYLNSSVQSKRKLTKKESLESSMRLTGAE